MRFTRLSLAIVLYIIWGVEAWDFSKRSGRGRESQAAESMEGELLYCPDAARLKFY